MPLNKAVISVWHDYLMCYKAGNT